MRSARCFNGDVLRSAALGRVGRIVDSESDAPKRAETAVLSAVLKCRCDGINVGRSVGRHSCQ
jgi:hypothetical protein